MIYKKDKKSLTNTTNLKKGRTYFPVNSVSELMLLKKNQVWLKLILQKSIFKNFEDFVLNNPCKQRSLKNSNYQGPQKKVRVIETSKFGGMGLKQIKLCK